jgi:hypothetical protein
MSISTQKLELKSSTEGDKEEQEDETGETTINQVF